MKIAIGCDNLAINLKEAIITFLEEQDQVKVEIKDFGILIKDLAKDCLEDMENSLNLLESAEEKRIKKKFNGAVVMMVKLNIRELC